MDDGSLRWEKSRVVAAPMTPCALAMDISIICCCCGGGGGGCSVVVDDVEAARLVI